MAIIGYNKGPVSHVLLSKCIVITVINKHNKNIFCYWADNEPNGVKFFVITKKWEWANILLVIHVPKISKCDKALDDNDIDLIENMDTNQLSLIQIQPWDRGL